MTTEPSAHTSARRIARNTAYRVLGDLVGKIASLFFFIAVARELGASEFGEFTFVLALTGTLILASGLGTDTLTAREVARSGARLDDFLGNVVTLKVVTSAVAVVAAFVIVHLGDRSDAATAAVLVGIGVAIENLGRTWYAAFQAFERMEFISISLAVQRVVTAVAAILVLDYGSESVAAVGLVYLAGSLVGLAILIWSLPRFVVSPRWRVDRGKLIPLALAGIPIGLASLLFTLLLRVDTVLLGFLSTEHQVGVYGAAFRLVEATMFLSWALGAAMLPWMSRRSAEGDVQLVGGYELGLKTIAALLVPVALACSLLAEPIIRVLYGSDYAGAVNPLRILGPLSVLYGLNYLTATTLTAHDRPGLFTRLFAVVTAVNLGLDIILIPRYGAVGAAISATASGLVLVVLGLLQSHRTIGAIDLGRVFGSAVAGGIAMAAVIFALDESLVPSLILGTLTYLLAFGTFERIVFPQHFRLLVGFVRRPESLAP